jgi:hypothetical protein
MKSYNDHISGVHTVHETPPSRKSALVHSPTSGAKLIRVIGRDCTTNNVPPSIANSMSCGAPKWLLQAAGDPLNLRRVSSNERMVAREGRRPAGQQRIRQAFAGLDHDLVLRP